MKVISYHELVMNEGGTQVQKGMNFRIKDTYSIVLMSTRKNAPYNDKVFENGEIEYEGHDAIKSKDYDKKLVDQPMYNYSGSLTENGKFFEAARKFKEDKKPAERIKVYRKIRNGVWVDMDMYNLVDGFVEFEGNRNVFKFILNPIYESSGDIELDTDLLHNRQIPGEVQRKVYERDKGRCTICGSTENLHFDHIVPFSKGGSSKVSANIQLLCAKHNLKKGAKFI